jgi:hypothetical protein
MSEQQQATPPAVEGETLEARLAKADNELALMMIAGGGPERGMVSEGCVQISLKRLHELRTLIRETRRFADERGGMRRLLDTALDTLSEAPEFDAIRRGIEREYRALTRTEGGDHETHNLLAGGPDAE